MCIRDSLFTAACILAAVGAMAQGNGQAGITEATQMVTSVSYTHLLTESRLACIRSVNIPVAVIANGDCRRYSITTIRSCLLYTSDVYKRQANVHALLSPRLKLKFRPSFVDMLF